MQTVFNQSIWGDEGFSAILSMKSLPEIIKTIMRDTSPPLWNICEWIVFNTFGSSEVYIRSLSLVFFLGTVFFTYKIGAHLFNKRVGILASLLTLFNPFFFTYAFEGRMYSIMSMGVAGSMYYFLKIFMGDGEVTKTDKIGYVVFTLWALYSHHFAIFAVVIQGLWFIYEFIFGKRVRAKKIFRLFIITGVLYLPWLYPLYTQTRMVAGGFWLGKPDLKDLRNLIYEYLAEGIKDNKLILPNLSVTFYHASLWLILTITILKKWWVTIKKNIFLVFWFLGPILLAWVVSQKFQSIFYNRYLLYTIPGAMIALASGKRRLTFVPLFVALLFFVIIDFNYFFHPAKLPFRELSNTVKSELREGDFLVNWNGSSHHLWETKYYGIGAPIYIPEGGGDLPFFVGTALMEKNDIIRKIPANVKRVGVVTSGPPEEVVISGYSRSEVKNFGNLKFIWYGKENK